MADIKERKKVIYDLHVDLTRGLHEMASKMTIEQMEECAGAYIQTMRMEDGDPMPVDRPALRQMATLAMYSLTRFMNEKYKQKGKK